MLLVIAVLLPLVGSFVHNVKILMKAGNVIAGCMTDGDTPTSHRMRLVLGVRNALLIGSGLILGWSSDLHGSRGAMAASPEVYGFKVLPSGLEIADFKVGKGEATVEEGRTVVFQWVLRRSNGYFVDASSNYGEDGEGDFIYKVGNKAKVIAGIDEGIRGMKVGGVRALKIPPAIAYRAVGDNVPGPMPAGYGPRRQILTRIDSEVWYVQVRILKIK